VLAFESVLAPFPRASAARSPAAAALRSTLRFSCVRKAVGVERASVVPALEGGRSQEIGLAIARKMPSLFLLASAPYSGLQL